MGIWFCQYTDAETVKVVNDKDTVTVCDTSIYRVCHWIYIAECRTNVE